MLDIKIFTCGGLQGDRHSPFEGNFSEHLSVQKNEKITRTLTILK